MIGFGDELSNGMLFSYHPKSWVFVILRHRAGATYARKLISRQSINQKLDDNLRNSAEVEVGLPLRV